MFKFASRPWLVTPQTYFSERRAIIVGAGLSGANIAYSLAKRGWQIIVIDRHAAPAREASGIAAGIVLPRLTATASVEGEFHRLAYWSALALFERLQKDHHRLEYHRCGALLLATNDSERQRQQKLAANQQWTENQLQMLSAEQAAELSQISLSQGGLWLPHSGWLDPSKLSTTLLAADEKIKCLYDTEVAGLKRNANRWQLFDQARATIAEAEVVIIANGNKTHRFQQTAWLPLQSIRGQTTRVQASATSGKLGTVISGAVYLTPAQHGYHILGATFQRDDTDIDLRPADDAENLTQLVKFAPALANSLGPVTSDHAALRAVTPDRLPVVGAVPDYAAFQHDYRELWKGKPDHHYPPARHINGLYIATGFGARGLSITPLAAQLLAAMINGETLPLPQALVDALNPARFIVKTLRRPGVNAD